MGLLDELFGEPGDDASPDACDIASDMLKDSKFTVISLASAITETTNHEVRSLLQQKLNAAIDEHYKLADIVVKKGWYQPHLTPQRQISQDMRMARGTAETPLNGTPTI